MSTVTYAIEGYLASVLSRIRKQETSIGSCLIIVTTAYLNHVLKNSYFKCPSTRHFEYGCSFLFCPGVLLALLALLASDRFSKTITGACRKDQDVPEEATGGKRKRTWYQLIRNISIAMAFSMLAFMSWIIVSLISTETYACIKIGPPFVVDKARSGNGKKRYDQLKEELNILSKLIGLILLLLCTFVTLVIHIIIRCCFVDRLPKELSSMRSYDEIEAKAANEEFKILMEKSAEARGKDMVKRLLELHCQAIKDPETPRQRDDIVALRRFLALRYPKLDMIGAAPVDYCQQDRTPEQFSLNQVDGRSNEATSTEIVLGYMPDSDRTTI